MLPYYSVLYKYVTRFHKRANKSLGPIPATDKEVRDNHHVTHLTFTNYSTERNNVILFILHTAFQYKIKLHLVFVLYCTNILKLARMPKPTATQTDCSTANYSKESVPTEGKNNVSKTL